VSLTYDAPDIAKGKPPKELPIDLVGIQGLQIPIKLNSSFQIPAHLSVFVSLDQAQIRGVHMSRLYLAVHKYFDKHTFKASGLKKLLKQLVQDQKNLSSSARIEINLDWPTQRKALKSSLLGWRVYPVFIRVDYSQTKDTFDFIFGINVTYSSTCPCSASLSQEMIKKKPDQKSI